MRVGLLIRSLHIANFAYKGVARALLTLIIAAAMASCQPNASEGIKFGWFYRMVVELSHGGEPLNIEVIIGCGSQERQILGEGRSVRAIWAPYIYGVRTKNGEGVLVQSPNICDRDLVKQPMPADFLPVVFWAPDAGNLEFMIASLHEQAYTQPVAKLAFHKATFTEATKADYEAWIQTKWKDNIVPLGDRGDEYSNGSDFFRGAGFFPKGDPRNASVLRLSCHAMLRVPIAGVVEDKVRERWPAHAALLAACLVHRSCAAQSISGAIRRWHSVEAAMESRSAGLLAELLRGQRGQPAVRHRPYRTHSV
jgi:hypothetical protein